MTDLSIVLPTLNERENLETLIPALGETARELAVSHEVIVADGGSSDGTTTVAERLGARVVVVRGAGYGAALRAGLDEARGEYVVTMDADLSHDPRVIRRLWEARDAAAVAVASRYVPGGSSVTGGLRLFLSRVLNLAFARGLALPVRDVSSGFRLYPRAALAHLRITARDFDALQEILVRAHLAGWRIVEVPFGYAPRRSGTSKARLLRLGPAYARTFVRLWRLRRASLS